MSVIMTGSFGAKRRQEEDEELARPAGVSTHNKRFRLSEIRASISPPIDESIAYVEVGETSETGGGIFSIERILKKDKKDKKRSEAEPEPSEPGLASNFEYGRFKVLPHDQYNTEYIHFDGSDLRGLQLSLRCSSVKGSAEVVFWNEAVSDVKKRNILLARRKYKGLLKRAMSNGPQAEIAARLFTPYVIKGKNGVRGFVHEVNEALSAGVNDIMLNIMTDPKVRDYRVATVGQMIIAFMLAGGHLSEGEFNFKTRIMFLFLETLIGGYEGRSDAVLFSSLFTWLVLGGCDSCFEKVLLTGQGKVDTAWIEYPYSMESFALTDARYLSVVPGSKLEYEMKSHPVAETVPSRDCTIWKVWEHSYVRPRYVHGVVKFSIASRSGQGIEIKVQQHWGMSLISCLDGLHKGLKHATFGGGNSGLIGWAEKAGFVVGNDLTRLENMLIDLTLISESHNQLAVLAENILGYIAMCVVPRDLVDECRARVERNGQDSIDFYDIMVRFCFVRRSHVNNDLMTSLVSIPSLDDRLQRLRSEDLRMTMVHYVRNELAL